MNFYDMLQKLKLTTRLENPGSVIIEFGYDIPFDHYNISVTDHTTNRKKRISIDANDLKHLPNDAIRNRNLADVLTLMIQNVMEV